jgi:holo-[acyl-carrier protein] synthase
MIKGVGIDLVEVERFRRLPYKKYRDFYEMIFTARERRYCLEKEDPARHFAARFAAKEAIIKALNLKIGMIPKIEILHDQNGQPQAKIKNQKVKISVSVSHLKDYAVAIAIASNNQ